MDINDTLTWDFEQKWSEGSNILGMIVGSIVFGTINIIWNLFFIWLPFNFLEFVCYVWFNCVYLCFMQYFYYNCWLVVSSSYWLLKSSLNNWIIFTRKDRSMKNLQNWLLILKGWQLRSWEKRLILFWSFSLRSPSSSWGSHSGSSTSRPSESCFSSQDKFWKWAIWYPLHIQFIKHPKWIILLFYVHWFICIICGCASRSKFCLRTTQFANQTEMNFPEIC